ncbi:MAG: sigma-70 family RNA polymerase sigma factor [Cellvibrionaceae bacterium]
MFTGVDIFKSNIKNISLADDELVELAKRELPYITHSYECLMLRYQKLIRHVVFGVVKDRVAVDDVVQEVMIKIFNKLLGFEGRSSFKTWLMTICMNTSISYTRKNNRHKLVDNPDEDDGQLAIEDQFSRIDFDSFEKMIASLDEKERHIVTLKFVAELEFQEIATALEMGLSAIKMRYYRAVEKLRDKM